MCNMTGRGVAPAAQHFGQAFEREFVNQGLNENRSMEQTLTIGWKLLSILPRGLIEAAAIALGHTVSRGPALPRRRVS